MLIPKQLKKHSELSFIPHQSKLSSHIAKPEQQEVTTHLPRHLGAQRGWLPSTYDLLEEALLRLREHEFLQHAGALGRDVHGGGPRSDSLGRDPALPEPRECPRRTLEGAARGLDPDVGGAVRGKRDLGVDGAEVEEHGGLLEVDGGEGALLVPLEGIVPGEGEGVDVGAVGGDGEAGLHERQGPRVGEERVAALLQGGRVREGGLLDSGAEVAHHGKVVVGRGGLALRVDGGDVEAQRASRHRSRPLRSPLRPGPLHAHVAPMPHLLRPP